MQRDQNCTVDVEAIVRRLHDEWCACELPVWKNGNGCKTTGIVNATLAALPPTGGEVERLRAELARYQGEGADAWDIAEEHRRRADAAELELKTGDGAAAKAVLDGVHRALADVPAGPTVFDKIEFLEANGRVLAGTVIGVAKEKDARIASLEAQLAATERELERWKHNLQVEGDYVCPDSLALTETQAQLAASQAALRKYGEHEEDCPYTIPQRDQFRCDCGLDAALQSLPERPAGGE